MNLDFTFDSLERFPDHCAKLQSVDSEKREEARVTLHNKLMQLGRKTIGQADPAENPGSLSRQQEITSAHWDSYWDRQHAPEPPKIHWWDCELVGRHINKLVSGRENAGSHALLEEEARKRPINLAISIGCGMAHKELSLLESRIVERFVCFDLVASAMEYGKEQARRLGLADRIEFHRGEAIAGQHHNQYDLVYWNNALHHMEDVGRAVRQSHDLLKSGGVFFMDDYVGPRRFQWTDANLALANQFRRALPERLLLNQFDKTSLVEREIRRQTVAEVTAEDPSEAAESDLIVPAVTEVFPNARVILTGGTLYHLVLQGIAGNFSPAAAEDAAIITLLLTVDQLCTKIPEIGTHYAVAVATKP